MSGPWRGLRVGLGKLLTPEDSLGTFTKAGNCSVKATKASSGIYAVAVSPVIVFAFTLKK
jgi:hypothetical protein